MLMNGISGRAVNGSSPLSRRVVSRSGIARGGSPWTAFAIARMWSGVVPQQPPTMFNQPCCAQSRSCGARLSGVSGNPVAESGSGSPAFGYVLTRNGAIRESSSIYGRISFGPRAQLSPIERSGKCETEVKNASTVCPVSVRPLRSVIVPETITGRRGLLLKNSEIANSAALAFSVSKMVSTSRMSTPPATRFSTCSR